MLDAKMRTDTIRELKSQLTTLNLVSLGLPFSIMYLVLTEKDGPFCLVLFSKPIRPLKVGYIDSTKPNPNAKTVSNVPGTQELQPYPSYLLALTNIPPSPSFQLLQSYMMNNRWIWQLPAQNTILESVQLISRARFNQVILMYSSNTNLCEGYILVNTSGTFTFLKELKKCPSCKEEGMGIILEYIIYTGTSQFSI